MYKTYIKQFLYIDLPNSGDFCKKNKRFLFVNIRTYRSIGAIENSIGYRYEFDVKFTAGHRFFHTL